MKNYVFKSYFLWPIGQFQGYSVGCWWYSF